MDWATDSHFIRRFTTKFKRGATCWNWTAGVDSKGYGVFAVKRRPTGAHRVSYELYVGPIPEGKCVLHHCDNPKCVNPHHLWIGTKAENNVDRARKGRNGKAKSFPDRKGIRNARSKLTEKDVIEIRKSKENTVKCAQRFGVTNVLIGKIRRRLLWKHI